MPERHGDQVVETATEARAAKSGVGLNRVLAISTIAVAIIFALMWLYYFA